MSTDRVVGLRGQVRPDRLWWRVQAKRRVFWREFSFLAALYAAYSATRLLVPEDTVSATSNAGWILDVEHLLNLDIEKGVNTAAAASGVLSVLTSYWYASLHYVVTLAVLVVVYRRAPAWYPVARTNLVGATLIALVGYALFPTAPPRLMDGYTDVLAETSGQGWWGGDASAPKGFGGATNELAAMPSMHVGWAVWVVLALTPLLRWRWLRIVVWLYPAGTAAVVVATGNHWVLDVVVGAALVVAVAAGVGLTARRRSVAPDRQ